MADVNYKLTEKWKESSLSEWDGFNDVCRDHPNQKHHILALAIDGEGVYSEFKEAEIEWLLQKGMIVKILEDVPEIPPGLM